MNGRTIGISAAAVFVASALIYAFGDHLVAMVTPERVAHLVALLWAFAKAAGCTLLAWTVDMPTVNGIKWQFIEPDTIEADGTPRWTSFKSRRNIRLASWCVGTITLTPLLAIAFWPLSALAWALVLICGFGLGGAMLSPVYELTTGTLIPLARRALVGMKRIVGRDGVARDVPADYPTNHDEGERTQLPETTQPRPGGSQDSQ